MICNSSAVKTLANNINNLYSTPPSITNHSSQPSQQSISPLDPFTITHLPQPSHSNITHPWTTEYHSTQISNHQSTTINNITPQQNIQPIQPFIPRIIPQQLFPPPSIPNDPSWQLEFSKINIQNNQPTQSPQSITIVANSPTDALAQTAGLVIDSIKTHPKLRNSQFMKFMSKLHAQEITIENNKTIENIDPVNIPSPLEHAQDWASQIGTNISSSNWEEEFPIYSDMPIEFRHKQQSQSVNVPLKFVDSTITNQNIPHSDSSAKEWAQEFSKVQSNTLQTNESDEVKELERSFHDFYGKNHDDWTAEFKNEIDLMKKTQMEDPKYNPDFNMENFPENQLLQAPYEHYAFSPNNPFLNQHLNSIVQTPSHFAAERILRLEGFVQQNSTDSLIWHQLGLAQQENENDLNAIAALRKSTAIDPSRLDSWILLATSYTNENFKEEALNALQQWLFNHPDYSSLSVGVSGASINDIHQDILGRYLQAARLNPSQNLDPDIQIALGILLNMSFEYDKAVDCFKAALSKKVDDYMLWNKLGATLANSNHATEAINAYHKALDINPSYIRARCNLAISCMQLAQYQEAARHLINALEIQSNFRVAGPGGEEIYVQSVTVWKNLRMVLDSYLHRPDLVSACDRRDLDLISRDFV